jgi:tetratricopeptide (TPR) repeat protein
VELAGLALRAGRDEASMREARVARSLNPDAVEPHLVLGDLFLRQGRRELATMEYERAIELSPGRVQPVAKIRAAESYLVEGRELARALRHLEEAQLEGSSNAEILALVASLYSRPGAPPEFQARASSIWKRVAALDPLDVEARLRIAVAPLLTGDPTRPELLGILETLDRMIQSNPEFDPAHVRYFRALTLERLGRREEALRAYREVTLLTGVAPFRKRTDDEELDAAIEALRTLQSETRRTGPASRGADSSPTRPGGR